MLRDELRAVTAAGRKWMWEIDSSVTPAVVKIYPKHKKYTCILVHADDLMGDVTNFIAYHVHIGPEMVKKYIEEFVHL